MSLAIKNLDKQPIVKGASWKFSLNYKLRNSPVSTSPVDISGCKAHLDIKQTGGIIRYSSESGDISLDIPGARIAINLTPAKTALINWTQGEYFLHVEFPSGEIKTILSGRIYAE